MLALVLGSGVLQVLAVPQPQAARLSLNVMASQVSTWDSFAECITRHHLRKPPQSRILSVHCATASLLNVCASLKLTCGDHPVLACCRHMTAQTGERRWHHHADIAHHGALMLLSLNLPITHAVVCPACLHPIPKQCLSAHTRLRSLALVLVADTWLPKSLSCPLNSSMLDLSGELVSKQLYK